MAKKYTVKITEHAEEALRELTMYIAIDLQAPGTAVHYIERLRAAIKTLEEMPERISLTKEEPWHTYGIHQMIAEDHYIYFWIDEENRIVQVTDVIYTMRDQRNALMRDPVRR